MTTKLFRGEIAGWELARTGKGSIVVTGLLDGNPVRTSAVTLIDFQDGRVETTNSVYALASTEGSQTLSLGSLNG